MAGAAPLLAQSLTLPEHAQPLATRDMPFAPYNVPIGPWADGKVSMERSEGRILRRSWRINSAETTLQVFDPLRQQIRDQGYQILFQCHDTECGGFDFRFAIDVVPAPDMAVDFGDYLFLSAKRAEDAYLTLLVSRFGRTNFVQLVQIGAAEEPVVAAPVSVPAPSPLLEVPVEEESFPDRLIATGHAVLEGLEFNSGSPDLTEERYEALGRLAEFLETNPNRRVLLVGHTDTVGGLSGNIALSLARAKAVKRQLQLVYGSDPKQIDAAGAGYLSPLTSNDAAEGREINRRVEAVLLPVE